MTLAIIYSRKATGEPSIGVRDILMFSMLINHSDDLFSMLINHRSSLLGAPWHSVSLAWSRLPTRLSFVSVFVTVEVYQGGERELKIE